MSRKEIADLKKFLSPFNDHTLEIVYWLRDFVWDLYPNSNELIYDNYNALAIGWSVTDRLGHTFCNIAVGRTSGNIHFGFYRGNEVDDPDKLLIGKGNQYRYLLVKSIETFPKAYIKKLLTQAYSISLARVKDKSGIVEGTTITKAISAIKRVKKNPASKNKIQKK